jgi:hypothetical protein
MTHTQKEAEASLASQGTAGGDTGVLSDETTPQEWASGKRQSKPTDFYLNASMTNTTKKQPMLLLKTPAGLTRIH